MIHRIRKKSLSFSISPIAARVLHIGLPVILLEMLLFLQMLKADLSKNANYALHHYPPLWEHIMIALTLLVIGAFLFDYISRQQKNSPP